MKSSDKFLIGIVAGILVLIVVAFIIILTRPEPTYQSEDTPEGIAHNYLLALQNEEYERAHSYLSPTLLHYPRTVEDFIHDVERNSWRFRSNLDTTLSVDSAKIIGNRAVVEVRESSFRGGDLFDTSQSLYNFEMDLQVEEGVWKIVSSDYYFAWCWTRGDGCSR